MRTGIELITQERQRQIEQEGWTAEHDDEHIDGSLAMAAACFAAPIRLFRLKIPHTNQVIFLDPWPKPWSKKWDRRMRCGKYRLEPLAPGKKKEDHRILPDPDSYTKQERLDLLVKAGALIAAEIDRLQRLVD